MRWLIPSGGKQVHLPSKEVFQEEGQVHKVPESRLFELHQDVNVAGLLLLATDTGTKKTNAADGKAFLYLLIVAAKNIDGFQGDTSRLIYF